MERESFAFEKDDVTNPITKQFLETDIASKASESKAPYPEDIEFPDLWSLKNIGNLYNYKINR